MADHLTKEKRSWNMSRIRSKNTKPEMLVRSLLFSMGFHFRLYGKVNKKLYKEGILPGKPDIVISKYQTVIFVHGCFWHRHENCKKASMPKTRTEWWQKKFSRNIENDNKHQQELKNLGWKVVVIWECEIDEYRKEIKKIIRNTDNNKITQLEKKLLRELPFCHQYLKQETKTELIAAEDTIEYRPETPEYLQQFFPSYPMY